jgi:hypothetical protein
MYNNVSTSVKQSFQSFEIHENFGVQQGEPMHARLVNIHIDDMPDNHDLFPTAYRRCFPELCG